LRQPLGAQNAAPWAGSHLLIDLWASHRLDDPEHIRAVLRQAALDAGCTILQEHFHVFTPFHGVTGALLLAESHISIHTWPERGFAAVDAFMCGHCDPRDCLPALHAGFALVRVEQHLLRRGVRA
jgi:S-adenosylmethionine decarboxylase